MKTMMLARLGMAALLLAGLLALCPATPGVAIDGPEASRVFGAGLQYFVVIAGGGCNASCPRPQDYALVGKLTGNLHSNTNWCHWTGAWCNWTTYETAPLCF